MSSQPRKPHPVLSVAAVVDVIPVDVDVPVVPVVPVVVVPVEVLEAVVVVADVGSQDPPRSRQPPRQSPRLTRIALRRADTPRSYTPAAPTWGISQGVSGACVAS